MISETLLEMHYFRALANMFERHYGGKLLTLWKPSPQQEAWVGFDQGWIRSAVPDAQLRTSLQSAIRSSGPLAQGMLFGFFLQFKVVARMSRRSDNCPAHFTCPYLRVELSLDRNKRTGLSQHETLLRLSRISGANVNYACPMLFDASDVLAAADLESLRIVDFATCPSGWVTKERHFIAFQNPPDADPFWCSAPVPARAQGAKQWLERGAAPEPMSAERLIELLASTELVASEAAPEARRGRSIFQVPSLTLLHLGPSGAV